MHAHDLKKLQKGQRKDPKIQSDGKFWILIFQKIKKKKQTRTIKKQRKQINKDLKWKREKSSTTPKVMLRKTLN